MRYDFIVLVFDLLSPGNFQTRVHIIAIYVVSVGFKKY